MNAKRGLGPETPRSSSVLPAHAGLVPGAHCGHKGVLGSPRARGAGPVESVADASHVEFSPRTRGWSGGSLGPSRSGTVLPAHAGLVLTGCSPRSTRSCSPRARGAGLWPRSRSNHLSMFSPRTRGWSREQHDLPGGDRVLPAHAGLVLPSRWRCHCRSVLPARAAPATRGHRESELQEGGWRLIGP